MSIYIQKPDETWPAHIEVAQGLTLCFLCHEKLGKTAIHWAGTHEIYFHPTCAISFSRRLMEDCERYFARDANTPLHNVPNQE